MILKPCCQHLTDGTIFFLHTTPYHCTEVNAQLPTGDRLVLMTWRNVQ